MIEKTRAINTQLTNLQKNQKKIGEGEFSKILSEALDSVNNQQKKIEQLSDDFATGKVSNIHEIVVEAEKASISLRLTVEVRNKIVEAYREIMRMQF